MTANILIIEDEFKIARFIKLELEHEGYQADLELDGRTGLEKAINGNYNLIILDIMLPSLNGMEVLRRLRQVSDVPVIMLTAKDDVTDKVMGLDMGADDYIAKPFAIEELLARIRVVFKHQGSVMRTAEILKVGKLSLNSVEYAANYDGIPIELTKKEFDLLKYLMQNNNIVLTRNQILEKVWGYTYEGDTNIVDVYIRYLRSKIDDRFKQKYLYTIRGVGYQLKHD